MKVSELMGVSLDYWVAKAQGMDVFNDPDESGPLVRFNGFPFTVGESALGYSPSTNWAHGGPIIEREKITVFCDVLIEWDKEKVRHQATGFEAMYRPYCEVGNHSIEGDFTHEGRTYLIAAMRAYVASKYGEEVPDMPTSA